MKPLGQIISSAGLRSRLVLLVLIGLLPVSGLVVYTSLKNQQDGLVGARGALLVTARLAALSQAGTDLKIMAGDALDASLPVALVVMDSRGTIIGTGGARTELLGTKVGDTALLEALKTRPAQTFEATDPEGVARIYAAAAVGGDTRSGLYAVASIPRETMTSSAKNQLALSLTLLAVLAAFGTVVARWMGHNMIVAPTRRLLHQVNSLAGVDAESHAGLGKSTNEVTGLSHAFHRMLDIRKARENERDGTEAALRSTRDRLLAAQRIGKIGSWEFDIAANQVWGSDQARELYGLTPESLESSVGTYERVLAQVFAQDRERFDVAEKSFVAGNGALDIEHRIVSANGEVRWVHVLCESMVNPHGKPVTLSGTVQDITDRKRADEAQRAGDAQFRLLTDAMPQIVWIKQADGCHTYFNQRWVDYTGLEVAESLGHGWTRLVHPDDSLRVSMLWEQALVSGEPCEIEYRLRRADGVYRWMLDRAIAQCDATGQTTQWLGTLTDIDDLKQATELVEKNFSMNRIAGRVARLGGWTIELPDRSLTWSDENCVIHDVAPGYQPTLEEGIGYFLPEHQAIVIQHVEACAQHGTPYDFVLPKLTAKGRRIWVRCIGEAQRDAAGKIVRLQGAFQDITEQKEVEARTLALETQLITTLESITDGFCLIDKAWKFTFLNGPAERMLKRRRKDILGKTLWQEFPETVGTRMEREYRLTVEEQRTTRFETFYRPLNTWFDVHVYPTEAGLAVYFQDITQRRLEQAQLRLLETAVSRLNDMVVITEAEAFDDAGPRIVFVNDAFERHTGYSREDAIGSTSRLLWGPKTQRAELDRIRAAMEKWQAVRAEIVIYTKAGKELWLETDIAPIADESGRFTHWVAVERDITERRQQREEILRFNGELEERVLLRTAELAAANKELESFAYSVSHDLRSPLNTIHGFSQLLLKIEAGNVSEKGKHYLDRIRAGVEQMSNLIEGLLTLAHLSREQIKSEHVDLSAIARLIELDYREREPQRQAQVHVHDGLSAQGDPRLLLAVFQNLLGNAWKFTSRQERAMIEVGSQSGADGEIIFFVKDNGAGFDMAFAHKLFGTFERLHSPGDFSGTGIGLATVKRVIERHGGRVWAESKLNEGAKFYFTLVGTTSNR
jgi:PAS domain S-box-containing protein